MTSNLWYQQDNQRPNSPQLLGVLVLLIKALKLLCFSRQRQLGSLSLINPKKCITHKYKRFIVRSYVFNVSEAYRKKNKKFFFTKSWCWALHILDRGRPNLTVQRELHRPKEEEALAGLRYRDKGFPEKKMPDYLKFTVEFSIILTNQ